MSIVSRLLRWSIDRISNVAGWLRRGTRVTPKSGPVRLNLGCGLAVAPGWINIDGSLNALLARLPRAFMPVAYRLSGSRAYYSQADYTRLLRDHDWVHYNLAYGIPFPDDSADFVYSSHFLEHLEEADARRLLAESYRVLKHGGVCRVCVPDLEHAIALYGAGNKEKMLRSYFFVEPELGYYARHKYMYDFELLATRLREAGFERIEHCAYQSGVTPDLTVLDNRPGETLYVEAFKS